MEHRFKLIEEAQQRHALRLDALEREEQRTRQRLHDLESDRAALRHLTKIAGEVFTAAKEMQDNALGLVDQAATSAVNKAFARKNEHRWKTALRVSTLLGSFAAVAFGLWTIIHG